MKKYMVSSIAPLIAMGIASAMAIPVFADETGTLVGCDNLQQTINNAADAPSITFLTLSENCSKDIIIPTGKNITLGTYQGSILSGAQGDTITVEEGATLYLKGGHYQNLIASKSVINNSGLTVIDVDRSINTGASIPQFTAGINVENFVINNSGEMNILSAVANNNYFNLTNSGVLRILKGGTNINEETIDQYLTISNNCNYLLPILPNYIPIGYKKNESITQSHIGNDAICGRSIYSSQSDIAEINSIFNNNTFSYAFEAKQIGTADIHEDLWENTKSTPVTVYKLESNIPGLANNPKIINFIASGYGYYYGGEKNNLILAVENNETISIDLDINEVAAENLDENDLAKINEQLGNGKILAYGNIGKLKINASERGLINEYSFLGGCNDTGCLENPIVDIKWSGLNLSEPNTGYKRNFFVIRLHNGNAEKIAAEIDENSNLVFPSGTFNTIYVVAYEDVKDTAEGAEETNGETDTKTTINTPNTGAGTKTDSGIIVSLFGCIITGVITALLMLPKIKKYLENR